MLGQDRVPDLLADSSTAADIETHFTFTPP
jgi:hypothetical protein